jgi:hypothetical protein
MPHYGAVEAGAMLGLCYPTARRDITFVPQCGCNSSLPSAFNSLYLDARNGGFTHLAMIHADVRPATQPRWLDVLMAIQEQTGAVVVSTVIPIKEQVPDPRVSTGIADEHDRWNVKRCLRLSDYHNTPETFGTADVCGPGEILVINTGLWVADLSHPCWDSFPGFQQHHRIGPDDTGKEIGQQRTEDWELSYHLHETGAKYLATWAVECYHKGHAEWRNRPEDAA